VSNFERRSAREEWQLAHDELLAKERHLAQLAVRFARREVPEAEIEKLHGDLEVFRKLANSLFSLAFGATRPTA
jgi:predicted dithiol-disulfide oxidoreductase (DUF899 family)